MCTLSMKHNTHLPKHHFVVSSCKYLHIANIRAPTLLVASTTMDSVYVLLLLIVSASGIVRNHRQRFPGPYCRDRRPEQCCPSRDDTCTVPIKDTVCYCDQFCALHNSEDCCPDYEDVCQGIPRPTTTPPSNPIASKTLVSFIK